MKAEEQPTWPDRYIRSSVPYISPKTVRWSYPAWFELTTPAQRRERTEKAIREIVKEAIR